MREQERPDPPVGAFPFFPRPHTRALTRTRTPCRMVDARPADQAGRAARDVSRGVHAHCFLGLAMKTKLLPIVLAACLTAGTAAAQMAPSNPAETGLATPIVALTGVLSKNADALGLDEAQRAAVKDWVATMPAKRKAVEDETVALRTELRAAIAAGAPREERQALAERIGANETRLMMMRSDCADNWRTVLSADQFAKLLALAGVK